MQARSGGRRRGGGGAVLKVLDADITTATPIYVTWKYSTWTRRGVVCNVEGKGESCELTYEGRCVFWEGGGVMDVGGRRQNC